MTYAQGSASTPVRITNYWLGAAMADVAPEGSPVEAALDIDERGKLMGCVITLSTGSARLDEAVCRMFKRTARFNVAKRAGKPIRATLIQRLRLMPEPKS